MALQVKMAVLALIAALVAQPALAKCYEEHDRFANTTLHWCAMGGFGMGETVSSSGSALAPIPMAAVKNASDITFAIKAIWKNTSWLFISPGAELVFILDDGSRITATTPDGSAQARDVSVPDYAVGVMVREEAVFPITADDMKRLAAAYSAEFAVYGRKGRFDGELDAKALAYYRDLYNTVLPPGP
jgi:hypothetical protein